MSSDSEPTWLREPAFKADLVAFSYAHGLSGRGWPDAVILDNGGDVRTSFYEQKSYVPQRTCFMDSVGHDAEHGRGERRFRCRACGHAFLYRDDDGTAPAPAFCPECGAQVLRAVRPGRDAYQVVAANLRSMASSGMAGADPLACIARAVFGTEAVGDAGALLARLAELMDPPGIAPVAEEVESGPASDFVVPGAEKPLIV